MTTTLSPLVLQRFFDSNGAPLAAGQLFTYLAGTSTPATTYTDSTGSTPNTNPIILDAAGQANVWLDPNVTYKFVLQSSVSSGSVLQWTVDNIVPAATSAPPRGYLGGLTLSTSGSSTTFSVAAGSCADSTNVYMMSLGSSINKTTSAWAVGTGNGALDTGSIASSTWYHVFLIRRPDTGVVDVLVSLSATSPSLPTNYSQFRRIGSIRTNGSSQWIKFVQDGDFFQWDTAVADVSATNPGASAVTRTLTVPNGVNVIAWVMTGLSAGASGEAVYLSDLAVADVAASNSNATLVAAPNANAGVQATVRTNTASQIRSRNAIGGATEVLRITTFGWYDSRGRNA
jgi:hypothetical protein